MPEAGNLGHLQPHEWDHLQELADQLEDALKQADFVDLNRFLPADGTPLRLVYLHELIKTEMEIRCRRQKTVSLDDYVQRYPELGVSETLPADLIFEEFRVRHRYGDKPGLEHYRRRFPAQYDQLRTLEKKDPIQTLYDTSTPKTLAPPATRPTDAKSKDVQPASEALPATLQSPPPAASTPSKRAPGSNSSSQLLPAGEGYQLLERIGKGQFGEVYRGLAPGGVVVAIKRVLRSMDDESSVRELKALEKIRELRHPYLLQTHNYYAFEDRLIIVMELADGSLHERFKECVATGLPGIPAEELLAYFDEAAEALDFLRKEKLSHRDIKPQNLLHMKGHAKVADFGISRQQENTVDHTMNVGGTPAYMPPEMWRGDISVHSDQYSLAITWYEMRTGRRVFNGKTHVDIAQQHLTAAPSLVEVPEGEQKVLARALAKSPDQRYPSCKEFVQELAEVHRPKPTPTVAPSRRMTIMLLTAGLFATASILFALICKSWLTVRVDWQPEGWKPLTPNVEKDVDGGNFYSRLVKTTRGGQQVVMVLVKKQQASDPPTFYMMENKVWNDLFAEFWADPQAQQQYQSYGERHEGTIRGEWLEGAWAPMAGEMGRADWDRLGVKGSQGRVPIFRVTVTEAYFFADWLGGRLPSQKQWFKAAGTAFGKTLPDADTTGPFQGKSDDATDIAVGLALNGPLPVGTAKRDVSVHGCRDMAGNGYEWTRDIQRLEGAVVPFEGTLKETQVLLVGQNYLEETPLTFKEMEKHRIDAQKYLETSASTSFRVVLERE